MLPEAVCNRIHANQADAVKTLSRLIGFPSVAAPQPQDGYPMRRDRVFTASAWLA